MTTTFITATGTDIGKTFVTVGLVRHIRAAGRTVDAIKPVVSGFDSDAWQESDPARLRSGVRSRWRKPDASRPGGSQRRCRLTWQRGAKAARSSSRRWWSFAADRWRHVAAFS
jgi:hypothetical protein